MRLKRAFLSLCLFAIVMVFLASCTGLEIQTLPNLISHEQMATPATGQTTNTETAATPLPITSMPVSTETPIVWETDDTQNQQPISDALVALTIRKHRAEMVVQAADQPAEESGFYLFAPPDRAHAKYISSLHGPTLEAIVIGDKHYLKEGTGWQDPRVTDASADSLFVFWLAPALAHFIWDPPPDLRVQYGKVGQETLDNIETMVYPVKRVRGGQDEQITRLWIAADTGLLLQIKSEVLAPKFMISVSFDYDVDVTIEAP
jgi:hypothetical protein